MAVGGLLFAGASTASASSVTLNFDSIATPNCGTLSTDAISSGYGGFVWDASLAVECNIDYMSGYGNSYGAPSPQNAIYNTYGTASAKITRATTFQFDGAMVSGWTSGDAVDLANYVTAQSITITGFLSGTPVGSETLTLAGADGSAALRYLPLGGIAGAIDTLQITTPVTNGSSGNFWLLDNFQYEEVGTGPNPVPEPASAVLVGLGLVATLTRRRGFSGFKGRVR